MHRASVIVICLLLGACSTAPLELRPFHSGFGATGSIAKPAEQAKRDLAAGRVGLAIRGFGTELGRNPGSLDALNGLAVAYARLRRYDVAEAYFERALAIDARDVAILNNYGRSLIEQGRLRDARPFLEQALRHADESDVPVIAANLLTIREAAPPRLVTALREPREKQAEKSHELIRVAANRYRLQTIVPPAGDPNASPGSSPRHASRVAREHAVTALAPPLPREKPEQRDDPETAMAAATVTALSWREARVPLQPTDASAEAGSAPGAAPTEAALEELEAVRAVIEQRVLGTGFHGLLDDIYPEPTIDVDTGGTDPGEWT